MAINPKPSKRKNYHAASWVRTRKKFLEGKKNFEGYYVCSSCGLWVENIEVDHIKKRSTHPHLIYDPSNLRALCHNCHTFATLNNQRLPVDNLTA